MTNSEGISPVEEEAPAVVAVGRTIGGILLVIVGIVLGLAGAIWFFIVPWFAWATEGFWFVMGEWADLGGMLVGVIGILLLIVGGALVQRARKKRLQIFMDAEDIANLQAATSIDLSKKSKPADPAPPTIV